MLLSEKINVDVGRRNHPIVLKHHHTYHSSGAGIAGPPGLSLSLFSHSFYRLVIKLFDAAYIVTEDIRAPYINYHPDCDGKSGVDLAHAYLDFHFRLHYSSSNNTLPVVQASGTGKTKLFFELSKQIRIVYLPLSGGDVSRRTSSKDGVPDAVQDFLNLVKRTAVDNFAEQINASDGEAHHPHSTPTNQSAKSDTPSSTPLKASNQPRTQIREFASYALLSAVKSAASHYPTAETLHQAQFSGDLIFYKTLLAEWETAKGSFLRLMKPENMRSPVKFVDDKPCQAPKTMPLLVVFDEFSILSDGAEYFVDETLRNEDPGSAARCLVRVINKQVDLGAVFLSTTSSFDSVVLSHHGSHGSSTTAPTKPDVFPFCHTAFVDARAPEYVPGSEADSRIYHIGRPLWAAWNEARQLTLKAKDGLHFTNDLMSDVQIALLGTNDPGQVTMDAKKALISCRFPIGLIGDLADRCTAKHLAILNGISKPKSGPVTLTSSYISEPVLSEASMITTRFVPTSSISALSTYIHIPLEKLLRDIVLKEVLASSSKLDVGDTGELTTAMAFLYTLDALRFSALTTHNMYDVSNLSLTLSSEVSAATFMNAIVPPSTDSVDYTSLLAGYFVNCTHVIRCPWKGDRSLDDTIIDELYRRRIALFTPTNAEKADLLILMNRRDSSQPSAAASSEACLSSFGCILVSVKNYDSRITLSTSDKFLTGLNPRNLFSRCASFRCNTNVSVLINTCGNVDHALDEQHSIFPISTWDVESQLITQTLDFSSRKYFPLLQQGDDVLHVLHEIAIGKRHMGFKGPQSTIIGGAAKLFQEGSKRADEEEASTMKKQKRKRKYDSSSALTSFDRR